MDTSIVSCQKTNAIIIHGHPYVENNESKDEEQSEDSNSGSNSEINEDSSPKAAPSYEENTEKYEDKTEFASQELEPPKNQQSNLPLRNTRALSKDASTYELERFERKVMVIFNQENVDGYKPRLGTDKDVEALTETFANVGFEVKEHKDFTKSQILTELRTFFAQDFTDVGCIAIAVLTHGSEYGILRAKDSKYYEAEITEYFESRDNPTMLTKPKVLIVQACRGTKTNVAMTVHPFGLTYKDHIKDEDSYTIPSEADLLILHSTYTGNPSFRNTVEGSWLIQSLCKHINALADSSDLESIIVAVKKEVAIERSHEEYSRRTNDIEINKQIPVMTSTLIRKLYLRKFGDSSNQNLNELSMMPFRYTNTQDSITSAPETPNENSNETPVPGSSAVTTQVNLSSKQYFKYLVKCLGYYLEENPDDTVAQLFLKMSKTFGKGRKFDAAKEEMVNGLCKYFINNEDKIQFYKYLFIKRK